MIIGKISDYYSHLVEAIKPITAILIIFVILFFINLLFAVKDVRITMVRSYFILS